MQAVIQAVIPALHTFWKNNQSQISENINSS